MTIWETQATPQSKMQANSVQQTLLIRAAITNRNAWASFFGVPSKKVGIPSMGLAHNYDLVDVFITN